MTTQAEMDFKTAAPSPATVAEVGMLVDYLKANPGWHTARALAVVFRLADRKVRQLAEHSEGHIVSSPGSPGYRHVTHCTAEEIRHAVNQLRSQGNRMLDRSNRLRITAHKLIA